MATASLTPHAWLQLPSPSYQDGLELLARYQPKCPWLKVLQKEDAYNRKKLLSLIQALPEQPEQPAPQQPLPPEPAQPDAAQAHLLTTKTKRFTPDVLAAQVLPQDLQILDAQWRRRYKLASSLQQQMARSRSDTVRGKHALEILDHFDFIRSAWKQIDHYRETGKLLPPENAVSVKRNLATMDLIDILRLRMNITPNIVKNRKRLATITDAKHAQTITTRIAEYEELIREIEQYLINAQTILRAAGSPTA